MKYRSGYAEVKRLRKYVNGAPTNEVKNNVPGDPDYRPKYLADSCPINTIPNGVFSLPIEPDNILDQYVNPIKGTGEESTLAFSEYNKGWTTFYSYIPENMINMNSDFYSFKDGQIWKHHANEDERNSFYGQDYSTEVKFVSNSAPSEVKIFKTIEIEGNSSNWDVTILTDLDKGHVSKESFKKKEGLYFSYIRRDVSDATKPELLSVQGIGNLVLLNNLTYTFNLVPGGISSGDALFRASGGSYQFIGNVSARTDQSLTIVGGSQIVPSAGDFMFTAKNPIAESFGLKGYYAEIKLTNDSTTPIEIFAVNSEVSKSYP
jgi:hypothetical protein|tara:strand:+ start:2375 stop:3331 length:957 start_codon:yes stop_codon:yes gene_type:complete